MRWRQRDHKLLHNTAHRFCMLDKQSYMHVRACTRPHARVPTRTHRPISNSCCFSTATTICESASLLRYTYTGCVVYLVVPVCQCKVLRKNLKLLPPNPVESRCVGRRAVFIEQLICTQWHVHLYLAIEHVYFFLIFISE